MRPSLHPSYPPFTARVVTTILVSGVTIQNKIIYFTDFTVIDESNLDKMIDFSSETELCTWENGNELITV